MRSTCDTQTNTHIHFGPAGAMPRIHEQMHRRVCTTTRMVHVTTQKRTLWSLWYTLTIFHLHFVETRLAQK